MRSCCPLSSQAAPLVQRGVPHRGEGIGSFPCAPSFRYPPQNIHAPYKEGGRYFFDPPKKYPKKCPLVSEAADPSAQEPYSGFLGISAQRWARLSARCPSGGSPTWLSSGTPAARPTPTHDCGALYTPGRIFNGWVCGFGAGSAMRATLLLHYYFLLGGPQAACRACRAKKWETPDGASPYAMLIGVIPLYLLNSFSVHTRHFHRKHALFIVDFVNWVYKEFMG